MRRAQVESQSDAVMRLHEEPRGARRRAAEGSRVARHAPPPVEIAFLSKYGVPSEALIYATALARRQGVSADAVLLGEGVVAEEVFYRALADDLHVPYLDGQIDVAPGAAATAGNGYVQLRDNVSGLRWLFAPRGPEIVRLMSAARGVSGRPLFGITSRARFTEATIRANPPGAAAAAAHSAERVDPELCVRRSMSRRSLAAATLALCLIVASFVGLFPDLRLGFSLLLAFAFLASVCLRLRVCAAGLEARDAAGSLADAQLPVYTLVIALYREAAVASQLARAIDRFDYPRAKLDVKFVVEIDDAETAAALRAHPPRTPHEIIVAPEGAPRTKPRALNVAMPYARGSLLAVFDAEDLPDGRQLRRAAAIFDKASDTLACLQASLVIDNGGLNWMTRLFAIEYAGLFDVHNKGLAALDLPLFLGGTSNHFRVSALREIGLWDAFNVTEDADIGLRLVRAGYRLRTFDSHTYEEAPAEFRSLVKQRTRWLKGWMQTALVHCGHPLRLVDDLGPRRTAAVLAMFVGNVLGPLLGPLLTGRLVYDALTGSLLSPATVPEAILVVLWCLVAVSGAAALVLPLWLGARRRGFERHALVFLPLWLLMLSLASWRAFYELWRRPFHWEKTAHGLTRRGVSSSGEEPLLEQEAGA
jgi:glycosyltransferase XagB